MILHLTTVHPRNDVRIWGKEVAAANAVYDTCLMVADGRGDSCDEKIPVYDIGPPASTRLVRMISCPLKALRRILQLRPELVQLHDPELLPVGLLLRMFGYRVIYDVHEDVPRQVLDKYWVPAALRLPISWVMSLLEWIAGRSFTAIVAATPTIAARFPSGKTITVQNFPRLEEFKGGDLPHSERPMHFVFTGVCAESRGAREMVMAAGCTTNKSIRLQFAGALRPAALEAQLAKLPGWTQVDFHGWVSRPQVADLLGRVRAGLVVFHPTRSHLDAFPSKMFEYMSAGLPVIAADFHLWREIIDGIECGLLVDPLDPQTIADAMQWISEHPDDAERMGARGRKAITTRYNWETESRKLLDLYDRLLG